MSEVTKSKRKLSFGEELSAEEKARETIETARKQLDLAIEQLDKKIQRRIEANQCKFLIAYKNHLDKITRQLKVLKQTYDVHEKKFQSDKAIISLGKQCTLFRQQAMRLHNQLEDAIAQADIYKRKSQILQSEIINTNDTLKKSIHSNKILEAERLRLVLEISRRDKQLSAINQKMNIQLKLNQSMASEQKASPEEASKRSQQDLRIKIPEVAQQPHVKIKDWLNRTGILRIDSPQTQRNRQTESNYKVFEKEGIYHLTSMTPKNRSTKGTHRGRNLTCSTIQYQSTLRQQSRNQFDYDLTKNRKSSKKVISKQFNQNTTDQQQIFNQFLTSLKNARAQGLESLGSNFELKSKNINELIRNDSDILELCRKLFPNLKISNNFEVNQGAKKRIIKTKTLIQLSTQLMQRFNIEKVGKLDKIKTENNLHLSSQELAFISKNKEPIKTEISENENKFQKLAAERAYKLKKMNESFKRKTLPSQSVFSSFYVSGRQRKKQ